jgi:leader peptidase (prepilin peptidase)/N-methyltransferase
MDIARILLACLAAIPGAWIALVLADRIPDAQSLVSPRPRFPFPRGLSLGDGSVYLVTALAYALAAARFEEIGYLIAYIGFFTVLIALSVMDIETLRLPDRLIFPSIGVTLVIIGAASAIDGSTEQIGGAVVTALGYFGVLFLTHLAYPAGMGFGDVKLAFLMGLYLGWPTSGGLDAMVVVVWAMLLGFGLGSITGIGVLVVKGRSAPYPFGPFLALGAALVILISPELLPEPGALIF